MDQTELLKCLRELVELKYPIFKTDCPSKRQRKIYQQDILLARYLTQLSGMTDEQKIIAMNEFKIDATATQ